MSDLFGFRLLNFEASAVQPKLGGEPASPLEAQPSMPSRSNGAVMSRVSAKLGNEP